MRFPSEKELKELREHYPAGARVEMIQMEDPQAPPVGTKGTVIGVDDAGSIMVRWDNGSSLNVAYGADRCQAAGRGVHEDCPGPDPCNPGHRRDEHV
jgi:hypothetical protein